MQTIKEILSAQIRAAFAAAFPDADLSALPLDATPAGDEAFGDYQCNGAMAAAKLLRRPPRAAAEAVVAPSTDCNPAPRPSAAGAAAAYFSRSRREIATRLRI